MSEDDGEGVDGIDASHAGLQKLYYPCRTWPIRPLVELDEALPDHKAYLASPEREGQVLLAGPLLDSAARYDGNGLIVFATNGREQAEELAAADPFHERGLRSYELSPWQVNKGSLTVRLVYSERSFDLR